jgi:hypothetical protein
MSDTLNLNAALARLDKDDYFKEPDKISTPITKRAKVILDQFDRLNDEIGLANTSTDTGAYVLNPTLNQAGMGFDAINIDPVFDFVKNSISESVRPNARSIAEQTLYTLNKVTSHGGKSAAFALNLSDNPMKVSGYKSITPINNSFNFLKPNNQSFGVEIDKVTSDIRMTTSVDILRYHASLTHKLVPVIPTKDAIIRFIKSDPVIFDDTIQNSNEADDYTKLVYLYEDDSVVKPNLPRVEVLAINGAPVVEDGILAPGKFDLLKLSLNENRPGYESFNKTDTIADSVYVEHVVVRVFDGTTEEFFKVAIGKNRGRLSMMTNADGSKRICNYNTQVAFTAESKKLDGTVSSIFSTALAAGEEIVFDLAFSVDILLRNGQGNFLPSFTPIKAVGIGGADPQAPADALLALLKTNANGNKLTEWKPFAEFSEENLSKSSLEVTNLISEPTYNLPTGTNYFYSETIMDNVESDASRAMSVINAIIDIGQGGKLMDDIYTTLMETEANVKIDVNGRYQANGWDDLFVAGSKVLPFVATDGLDVAVHKTLQPIDLPGNVKQEAVQKLLELVTNIHQVTKFQQQLGGSMARYRVFTSGDVLGLVLGRKFTYTHFENGSEFIDGGAGYRLVLDNDTILEIFTTTQADYAGKIVGFPVVSDKESELNMGAFYTFGTTVGHYTQTRREVINRMVANTRESFIPKNPMGFVCSISNVYQILDAYRP